MSKKVVVIGGGAAGLVSAYFAAGKGADVLILEQNEKLGKKLYITGKGRCNLTNACDCNEFLANVVTNPKFLMSAINTFPPKLTMEMFEQNGLPLKIERGNRVFPKSDKSSDVIKCLISMCNRENVSIHLCESVKSIKAKSGNIQSVLTDRCEYPADKVILATGGCSYSLTGSNGDGYMFASQLGHAVINPVGGLVGLEIQEDFCARLSGLSLKNVRLTAMQGSKALSSEFGEMLFTHSGVSGPIVLTTSSKINRYIKNGIKLLLDLKPALDEKQIDNRMLRDFSENNNKQLKNVLDLLVPKSLVPVIFKKAGLDGEKSVSVVTKSERQALISTLKRFEMNVCGLASLEQAIITSGGVSTKEINPKTMQSKMISGLYFAGEIIDVDALTGGFNLQIAFSTGYLAGIAGNN